MENQRAEDAVPVSSSHLRGEGPFGIRLDYSNRDWSRGESPHATQHDPTAFFRSRKKCHEGLPRTFRLLTSRVRRPEFDTRRFTRGQIRKEFLSAGFDSEEVEIEQRVERLGSM